MRTRGHLVRAALAVALVVSASACGGDDDSADVTDGATDAGDGGGAEDGGSGDDAPADDAGDAAGDDPGADGDTGGSSGVDLTHSAGRATVSIDGYGTYEFATVESAISVCTNLFGSFQVALPLVDETGAHIDGSEISMELIEPGSGADTQGENTPALEVVIPDGQFVAGDSGLAQIMNLDAPPLELTPATETSASGTVTLLDVFGGETVEATIDASCG